MLNEDYILFILKNFSTVIIIGKSLNPNFYEKIFFVEKFSKKGLLSQVIHCSNIRNNLVSNSSHSHFVVKKSVLTGL